MLDIMLSFIMLWMDDRCRDIDVFFRVIEATFHPKSKLIKEARQHQYKLQLNPHPGWFCRNQIFSQKRCSENGLTFLQDVIISGRWRHLRYSDIFAHVHSVFSPIVFSVLGCICNFRQVIIRHFNCLSNDKEDITMLFPGLRVTSS